MMKSYVGAPDNVLTIDKQQELLAVAVESLVVYIECDFQDPAFCSLRL